MTLRTGPGFRVRCPNDDGTTAHVAIDLHGRIALDVFARSLRVFKRCPCGEAFVMIVSDAPEPKDTAAERRNADHAAVKDHVRVSRGRAGAVLAALFADGQERSSRNVADALGVAYDAAAQMLGRSRVVERVRPGVWRLRSKGDA